MAWRKLRFSSSSSANGRPGHGDSQKAPAGAILEHAGNNPTLVPAEPSSESASSLLGPRCSAGDQPPKAANRAACAAAPGSRATPSPGEDVACNKAPKPLSSKRLCSTSTAARRSCVSFNCRCKTDGPAPARSVLVGVMLVGVAMEHTVGLTDLLVA
eukprot:CAMPEP_0180565976 /NCGR_PEP_ID=MMETSP1037_2-20121125/5834_1 /TAXON_ID=632150 /ORGANISM="Azadinium spinosum, Strain 3D9" /LENGTH=156 /DNA_ID=CAMNT_0022582985 /DNA_START=487 /DNA_END=957 /DNA_ORIENTATION=-